MQVADHAGHADHGCLSTPRSAEISSPLAVSGRQRRYFDADISAKHQQGGSGERLGRDCLVGTGLAVVSRARAGTSSYGQLTATLIFTFRPNGPPKPSGQLVVSVFSVTTS